MAKPPSKPAPRPARKPATSAKPKSVATPKPAKKPAIAKAAAAPAVIEPAKVAKARPAKKLAAAMTAPVKPAKAAVPKAPSSKEKVSKSLFKETSKKISHLAADILADRIVPTIDQIKAIAVFALGKDKKAKSRKSKGKKK